MIHRVAARSPCSPPDPVLSLVDYCYATLTGGSCDWQQLEAVPQSILVSLLQRCAAQRDELQARCDAQAAAAADAYYAQPPRRGERLGEPRRGPSSNYDQWEALVTANQKAIKKRLADVRSKWQPRPIPGLSAREALNPQYPTELCYIREERCFKLIDGYACMDTRLPRVISSALLLYRACCLFPLDVNTSHLTDRYKWVWTASLWHSATGRKLTLDESKASASVHLQWPAVEDKQLSRDFLDLMDLLCGDCPHPYDYVLAGSVA